MQSACFVGVQSVSVPCLYDFQRITTARRSTAFFARIQGFPRLKAQPADEDYVSYEGDKSVFPIEASEEVGSSAEGFGKEVKPKPTPAKETKAVQQPDRDYVDYKEQKTVFPGEACDELGGEFCESEYQQGVFPDKIESK